MQNRLRLWNSDVVFAAHKTLCHSALHRFKKVCNTVQKANETDITLKVASMDKSTFSDSLPPHLRNNGNADKRSAY